MSNGAGVYSITNTANGKMYVGSACRFSARWSVHKGQLRSGKHHSIHLQRAWNKYGEDAFEFAVLEETGRDYAVKIEQVWMDWLKPVYNICPTAGSHLGRKCSDETKAKLSVANTGRQVTCAAKANMAAARVGRKHSNATKAKLSAVFKGRAISDETKAKMRGRKVSDEGKARMSLAKKGVKKPPRTAEHRSKLAAAMVGNTRGKGYRHTVETLAQMTIAQQLRRSKEKRLR